MKIPGGNRSERLSLDETLARGRGLNFEKIYKNSALAVRNTISIVYLLVILISIL